VFYVVDVAKFFERSTGVDNSPILDDDRYAATIVPRMAEMVFVLVPSGPPALLKPGKNRARISASPRLRSCIKGYTHIGLLSNKVGNYAENYALRAFQRFSAAFLDISFRSSAVSFSALALPPFNPPSLPSDTAAGFFSG
jgi:hypothetical protein